MGLFWASPGPGSGPTCSPKASLFGRRVSPEAAPRQPDLGSRKTTQRRLTQRIFCRNAKTKNGHQPGRQGTDSGDTLCPKSYVFGLHFGPASPPGGAQNGPKRPKHFLEKSLENSFVFVCFFGTLIRGHSQSVRTKHIREVCRLFVSIFFVS